MTTECTYENALVQVVISKDDLWAHIRTVSNEQGILLRDHGFPVSVQL